MGKLYIGSTKVNMVVKQPNSTNGAGKMFVDVNSLPDGYLRLEHIQSTGTQYIDTLDYIQGEDTVEIDFIPSIDSGNYALYGSDNGNAYNNGEYSCFYYNQNIELVTPTSNSVSVIDRRYNVYVANTSMNIKVDVSSWIVNGTIDSKTTFYNNYTTSKHLYIFATNRNNSAGYLSSVKLHYFKWNRNGNVLHNYIPALRTSDYKPGLYDLVNNTFYYNQGSGEFTYQELPASDISVKFFNIIKTQQYYDALYLEDTYGDSYINTGVKLNQDSYVSCEFKVTQYQTNFSMACSPFGARTGWQNNAFNFYIPVNNSTTIYFSYGNQIYSTSSSNILNTTCVVVANKNNWSMVGATTASKTFTYTAFQNLGDCYMFNTNFYSENPPIGLLNSNAHLRISSLSIQDNGTLIRRFVPKVRNDGKPGMYDLCGSICPLTGTPFYINAGSHEFSYQV